VSANSKRFSLAGAALACVLPFAGSASAADWGGFYGGGSLGYGWGKAETSMDARGAGAGGLNYDNSPPNPHPKGALLGAQAGYNWQTGRFVVGAEGDASWTGMSDKKKESPFVFGGITIADGAMTAKQEIDWLVTLRARLGYVAENNWLVYATGGPAWGKVSNKGSVGNGFLMFKGSDSSTNFGWSAGAGAEWAMSKAYSVKFEYLHYNLGQSSDISNGSPAGAFQTKFRWEAKGNLLRAGVNFRF
jgi:outer membrane immunogenic protein